VSAQVRMHSQGAEFDICTSLHIASWQVLEDVFQSTYDIFEKLENQNNFDRNFLLRIRFKLLNENNYDPWLRFTFFVKVSWYLWVTNRVLWWYFAHFLEIHVTILRWFQDTRCSLSWNSSWPKRCRCSSRCILSGGINFSSRDYSRLILIRWSCPASPIIKLVVIVSNLHLTIGCSDGLSRLPCGGCGESYSQN